jgi:hypothetical protein
VRRAQGCDERPHAFDGAQEHGLRIPRRRRRLLHVGGARPERLFQPALQQDVRPDASPENPLPPEQPSGFGQRHLAEVGPQ